MPGFLNLLNPVSAGAKVGRKIIRQPSSPTQEEQVITLGARERGWDIPYEFRKPSFLEEVSPAFEKAFTPPVQATFRGLGTVATGGALPLADVLTYGATKLLTGEKFEPSIALKRMVTGKPSLQEVSPGFRRLAPEAMRFAFKAVPLVRHIPGLESISDKALTNLAEIGIDLGTLYGTMKLPQFGAKVVSLAPNIIKQKIIEKIPDKVLRLDFPALQRITSGFEAVPEETELFKNIEQIYGKSAIGGFTKTMRTQGYVDINIPGKEIVKWADKPWWSAIKQGFQKAGLAEEAGFARIKKELKGFGKLVPKPIAPIAGGLPMREVPLTISKWLEKGITVIRREAPIRMTQDMSVKDISGNKVTLPKGEEYTPYILSNNQIWLHDGKNVIVNKGQLQNIEGQNIKLGEQFAPELSQIEEVVKGGELPKESGLSQGLQNKLNQLREWANERTLTRAEQQEYDHLVDLENVGFGNIGRTKFSQYQLPGGENYREVLIKTPEPDYGKPTYGLLRPDWEEMTDLGNTLHRTSTEEKRYQELKKIQNEHTKNMARYKGLQQGLFKSPHWDEPNVLAHLRMNDRTTSDGKKVLFIEELQSDWAKGARDKGFVQELTEANKAEMRDFATRYSQSQRGLVTELTPAENARWEELTERNQTIDKVPFHPLLKSWQELALKRAVKEAVEKGYDYISWTTGEQQAERYDLSKHLKTLTWQYLNVGGRNEVAIQGVKIAGDTYEPLWTEKRQDLDKVIGKDIAKKINDAIDAGKEEGEFSGLDLKIGGEWAKNLYDRQIPNILKDLTKGNIEEIDTHAITGKSKTSKFGYNDAGELVPQGEGQSYEGTWLYDQPALKITPEIKARVIGQPIAGGLIRKIKPKFIIPSFKNTNEALKFGESIRGNIEKINLLKQEYERIKEISKTLTGQEAMNNITKGQLVREAFQEAERITPVQKIISALKEAKSVRGRQETLYTKERGQRLAKSLAIGEKVRGEKGFYAEKGALRGEYTKATFESIRGKLTQEDIDELFNQVKDNPLLNEWNKINAREGLAKLLGQFGGKVPTQGELKLLRRIFGGEFVQAVLDKRSLLAKIGEGALQIANIPRSIMASFDLSAPFRQGLFFATRIKQFLPAFTNMFKMFGSEKAFKELQESIIRHPNFALSEESKLSLTGVDEFLNEREEMFLSQWAEKLPLIGIGIRASERAYVGFLNKLRFDVFNDLVNKAEKLGLNPKEDRDLTTSIASLVNNATGRGSLGGLERVSTVLSSIFFSPRLMASRFNLINPIYYVRLKPFVRKEALKSLLSLIGIGATILTLAKMNGAEVSDDPRNADFGKIKIGNTRIDIWGGFQQIARIFGQLYTGQVVSSTTGKIMTLGEGYKPLTRLDILARFFEYKLAPITSFFVNMMKGQTGLGEKFNIGKEIRDRFVPMVVQDIYEIWKDNPNLLPLSGLGIFGVGVQTYKATFKSEKARLEYEQYKRFPERMRILEQEKLEQGRINEKIKQIQELISQGKYEEAIKLREELRKPKSKKKGFQKFSFNLTEIR